MALFITTKNGLIVTVTRVQADTRYKLYYYANDGSTQK